MVKRRYVAHARVGVEYRPHGIFPAEDGEPQVRVTVEGDRRSPDHHFRAGIASHGVERDGDRLRHQAPVPWRGRRNIRDATPMASAKVCSYSSRALSPASAAKGDGSAAGSSSTWPAKSTPGARG